MAQRISLSLLLLFLVSILIFAGTEVLPGDVAQAILGQAATPESLENLRQELGLHLPAYQRYLGWLLNFIQGDFGISLTNGRDIGEAISQRLGNTLFLATCAAVIAIPLSIFLGLLSVLFRDKWLDKLISAVSLSTVSLPEFLIGYILMYFFGVKLGWAPAVSMFNDSMSFGQILFAVSLPIAVLTLVVLAHMMRMTRAAILNVMQSAYIETAELKGLGMFTIIWRHAFPNAIAPVVNVVMLNLAYLVVGVVVIEVVFVYPGMGQFLVDHVSKRDVPVVQACGLIFASVYIILNLIADLVSILANPRLRHPK